MTESGDDDQGDEGRNSDKRRENKPVGGGPRLLLGRLIECQERCALQQANGEPYQWRRCSHSRAISVSIESNRGSRFLI
jgi:hypothetical protein